ncbi:gamma-butyrobetaine hydroxylase-like domain-containing protein [Pelagibaculum spongiae]|uniref:1-(5-phosphoribosyl)-5-((5-phosphoribosylamino)methylideneamino)imidazole-4-carboxamide isomerase n=1 Tax=Pelagibaculum spongiae TaxID=2080658 RepID=A0A2V1GUH0_9GAMM|nr:DUF971 domain-containing protein [Pelagibaculum spongiae]PVZ68297.1 1-(5-phosphoribosyl)-5-((5-phosphoribosylamino)methylideneamino)imidazole-4-carboxamide isomerase [Pelagibaculum spongiae]
MKPSKIQLKKKSRLLCLAWPDGFECELSCEFLRVHSPSAEVRGHGIGQETLQVGKQEVNITQLEAVGHYALKPTFDDGHDSGLFDWKYLRKLAEEKEQYWTDYLQKLKDAGQSRQTNTQVIELK